MIKFLKLVIYNANVLAQYIQEIETLVITHNIDKMLVFETYSTNINCIKIPNYQVMLSNIEMGRLKSQT